jgi:hypothetical protein
MASLLAINGGAAVACLNSDSIDGITKVRAGYAFAIGISFALMVAYSGQKLASLMIPVIQERLGYWLGVLEDGELDQDDLVPLAAKAKRILRFRFVSETFGWLSLLAFLAGLWIIGSELSSPTHNARPAHEQPATSIAQPPRGQHDR